MYESDQSTLKFGSTACVNGGGRKGLPDDGLADVGSDEQGDTGAKSVPLLEELVKEDDNKCGNNQLYNQEKADACT